MNDIIAYLTVVLNARKFANPVEVVDSDRESLFSNARYYDFLKENKVTISRGSSKGYDNKVVERLYRTIKTNLRALLARELSKDNKTALKSLIKEVSWDPLEAGLNKVIEAYNNTPHKTNYGLSPNSMDEAMFSAKSNK